MTQSKNVKTVSEIKAGEVITARHLNSMSTAINGNTQALAGPKQQSALEQSESGGASAGVIDFDFIETSRTSSTVTVTDSNGDTHQIEQIDQVIFRNGAGDQLTLTFTNP